MDLSRYDLNKRMLCAKLSLDESADTADVRSTTFGDEVPDVLWRAWRQCRAMGSLPNDPIAGRLVDRGPKSGKKVRGVLYSKEARAAAQRATDRIVGILADRPCGAWVLDLHGEVLACSESFSSCSSQQSGDAVTALSCLAQLSCIDDASCGTLACSLLTEDNGIRLLVGEQHYLSCFHDVVSAACGIAVNGEWVATALICVPWQEDDALLRIQSLPDGHWESVAMESLLSSLSAVVSLQLENLYQSHKLTIMQEVLENSIAYASEPLLITDDRGVVRTMNSSARRFLGIKRTSDDQPLLRLGSGNQEALSVLRAGRIVSNVRLDIELPTGQRHLYFGDVRPIFSADRQVLHGNTIRLRHSANEAASAIAGFSRFEDLIGSDQQFMSAKLRAMVGASSFEPVLLMGDAGTGKKTFARAIHCNSHDDDSTFILIDCATFTKEYAEKMLYGAFEADEGKEIEGVFERANQGTLVLNEVSELDLELQKAITNIMDMGTVRRAGEYDQRSVRVKLIATTSAGNLTELLESGKLDRGLYLRLLTTQISLPTLRERAEDIVPLAYHFINEFCIENDVGRITVEEEVISALKRYSWPGNLKQLRYFMRHACYLCQNRTIDMSCMPEELIRAAADSDGALSVEEGAQSMRAARARLITSALQNANGNMTQAAQILGVSRSTLYRWRREEGI